MKASALRLDASYLEQVEFRINPEFDPALVLDKLISDLLAEWKFASRVEIEKRAEKNCYAVRLLLALGERVDTPSKPPYYFKVAMVGVFTIEEGFPELERERLFSSNGPAVLYGALREIVFNMTARGPYAPIMLPTANFSNDAPVILPEVNAIAAK